MNRKALIAYAACALAFLPLDAAWLTLTADRLYRPAIGALMRPDFDWTAAALFYPLYFAGIVGFAILPSRTRRAALLRGAAFGFICYATYDLTNQATLSGWPWCLTAIDLAWGSTVTALGALAGRWAASNSDQ